MGLFGNQGSTKSSSSITNDDSSSNSANVSTQTGDAVSIGRGATVSSGGGISAAGSSRVYVTQRLDGKLAGDTVATAGAIAKDALNYAAQSNSILATLADHQQSTALSAVAGRPIGTEKPAAAVSLGVPLIIAAAALVAIMLVRK